ncbi:hypothetical protein TIFTF001_030356 [Ficus carica]|uniref:Uncharacterized protein n=1 Tax=Ficus carica TaxID=3494 RepID=A0AA88DXG0_FICCA|nr:hypothetical protein TIFTF001_030356 [Ficus carica]
MTSSNASPPTITSSTPPHLRLQVGPPPLPLAMAKREALRQRERNCWLGSVVRLSTRLPTSNVSRGGGRAFSSRSRASFKLVCTKTLRSRSGEGGEVEGLVSVKFVARLWWRVIRTHCRALAGLVIAAGFVLRQSSGRTSHLIIVDMLGLVWWAELVSASPLVGALLCVWDRGVFQHIP